MHTQKHRSKLSDNVTLELSLWISEIAETLEFGKPDDPVKAFTLQIWMFVSEICTCLWMHAQLSLCGSHASTGLKL